MVGSASGFFAVGFPTTAGAYKTDNSQGGVVVVRLDPSKAGAAQLVYSTFVEQDYGDASGIHVDANGVVTLAGRTNSISYPTTSGAFDTTYNGRRYNAGGPGGGDAYVARVDPSRTGSEQLVYSTFLGGSADDEARALSVDASGVVTVVGRTQSFEYPTTSNAYQTSHNGGNWDAFISRLDPSKVGPDQLVYSTFLGGGLTKNAVEPYGAGVIVGSFTPALETGGELPQLGNSDFKIVLRFARPAAPCVIAGSFARAETPMYGGMLYGDFVTPGEFLIWNFMTSPGFFPGTGRATLPIPIPNDPALSGLTTYWQAFVMDDTSPLPIGWSHTGGLEITVGF